MGASRYVRRALVLMAELIPPGVFIFNGRGEVLTWVSTWIDIPG